MFRIMQMFRMTYKYDGMRKILALVFKTASSVFFLLLFVIFVLAMFAVTGMIVLGGGCNPEYMESMGAIMEEDCEYRLRQINIEIAFCTNIEMTGFYRTILKFPDT